MCATRQSAARCTGSGGKCRGGRCNRSQGKRGSRGSRKK